VKVQVTISGTLIMNKDMDLELAPQVCEVYLVFNVCVAIEDDPNNDQQMCMKIRSTAFPNTIDAGCFFFKLNI